MMEGSAAVMVLYVDGPVSVATASWSVGVGGGSSGGWGTRKLPRSTICLTQIFPGNLSDVIVS